MALKSFRPLTPTLRFKSLPAFDEVTKTRPAKRLLEPKKKTGGRNHFGRLTSRHIGGGHKQHYRKVDFNRRKRGVEAEVIGIEYDPNGSSGYGGRTRWQGGRPHVAGRSMNPIDQPSGGGQRKSKGGGGRHQPVSPWGQLAKGFKARTKH